MPFDFPCPKCGRTILNVPESYAGQRGRCLQCKNLVTIPTMVITESQPVAAPSPPQPGKPGYAPHYAPATPRQVSEQHSPIVLENPPPPFVDTNKPQPRRKHQQLQKGLIPRRYPFLRKYCGILSIVGLIVGGFTILYGLVIAVSPLFGVHIPELGVASPLLFIIIGLAFGLAGYAISIMWLAGVDFIRVVMDIEENTRKLLDHEDDSTHDV